MEKKYKALIETSAKVLEETKPLQEYEEPHMDPDEFVGVGNKGQDYHKYQRNPEDLRWKRAEIEVPEPKKKVKRTVKRIVKDHVEVDEAMSGSSLEGGERGALGRGGGKITVGGVKNYAPYKYAKTGSEKESAIQRFKKQFPDRETGIDEKYEGKERRKINRFSKPERRKKEPMFTKSTKPQTPEEKQASLDYYTRAGKPFGRRVASRSFNLGDKNPPIKTEYRTDSVEYDGESLDERESMYRRGGGLDISKKLGRFGTMTQDESVELDELGRGTLDRYREKSKKQISDIEKSRKKKGEPVSSKYKKRLKGRRQATIRLSKKAMEDVELDEGRSFFKLTPDNYKKKAKTVLDKNKKHKVKTKGGGTETVSRDDLEAAGDVYDRLNAARKKAKGESVDYELQDSTKETLGRFIADSVGND